jgi:hypothetical protein
MARLAASRATAKASGRKSSKVCAVGQPFFEFVGFGPQARVVQADPRHHGISQNPPPDGDGHFRQTGAGPIAGLPVRCVLGQPRGRQRVRVHGPGDLFVIRNVGNIVPKHPNSGSTVAGLEYALNVLKVRHVIICGHSDCGAIRALSQNIALMPEGALRNWLRHSEDITSPKTEDLDSLSQKNVAQQIANLLTHPTVKERVAAGTLSLHGIWFDIRKADVYYLENENFILIDDTEGEKIIKQLEG